MKKILAIAFVALLGACTNAGPFVTNISADGNNGLVIEKCQVHMIAFMGRLSYDNCTTTAIKVSLLFEFPQMRWRPFSKAAVVKR